MINTDKIIIQLSVWFDGEEYETVIQGLNGSFDIDFMRPFLERPYFGKIHREITKKYGKVEGEFYSVYAEVRMMDSETQYGTGYGDILTLPAYYYIGDTLEIIKHDEEVQQ